MSYWSRAPVQVSGTSFFTSFLSVCHLHNTSTEILDYTNNSDARSLIYITLCLSCCKVCAGYQADHLKSPHERIHISRMHKQRW